MNEFILHIYIHTHTHTYTRPQVKSFTLTIERIPSTDKDSGLPQSLSNPPRSTHSSIFDSDTLEVSDKSRGIDEKQQTQNDILLSDTCITHLFVHMGQYIIMHCRHLHEATYIHICT